ncbi:MAG TPA: hypothetical protein VEO74_12795 [Thermoanaerobaculia bacterium]|nr:hypothetical protein [Thermoanaerobaculia bacterium]
MTLAIEVLMLLSSLLFVVGGVRAQRPGESAARAYGVTLVVVFGAAAVFAIVFYTRGNLDARVGVIVAAAMLVSALLYVRAYRMLQTSPRSRSSRFTNV